MILLDTNIFIEGCVSTAPGHTKARFLLQSALKGEIGACIAPQVLWEFFAVVTDVRRTKPPINPDSAVKAIETFLESHLTVITPTLVTIRETLRLLRAEPQLRGQKIFDIFLAATALEHGVSEIYTENTGDFKNIPGIRAINPLS